MVKVTLLAGGLALVALLALASVQHEERRVELFDWTAWTAQQQNLIHSADALTGRMSSAQEEGSALRQKLGDISNLVQPHKIIPMDQALAMLKVQKQMRSEDQEPHDRIEGAGDVAGLVDEKDEAMERNALREPAEGPDLDTANLFENCEDGSLTAEDAELCQRRASAIKLLTKSAVHAQMAASLAAKEKPAPRQNTLSDAKKELLAEAEIGKEYLERLRLLNERKQGLAAGLERKAAHTRSAPASALTTLAKTHGLLGSHQEQSEGEGGGISCSCEKRERGGGYLDGTQPACTCRGGAASALVQQPLPAAPRPRLSKSSAPKPKPAAPKPDGERAHTRVHGAGAAAKDKASRQAQVPEEAAKSTAGAKAGGKAGGKGDLGALASIAAAAEGTEGGGAGAAHAATRRADLAKGGAALAQLEKQISAGEAALAAKKLKFTEELTRRQARLQAAFAQSMRDVRAGLQLVDAVPVHASPSSSSSSSSAAAAAAAASSLSLQQLAPLPLAAPSSSYSSSSSSTSAALGPQAPVSAVMAAVQRSPLFRHPPSAAARAPAHPSEQATLRAALDDQFARVAAVHGGGAPPEQAVARQLRQKRQREQRAKELRAALKLTHAEGAAARGRGGHIGPASYSALWRAARKDLAAATEEGKPTLAAAASKAERADKAGGAGAAAQLSDAEKVLCSVAALRAGRCSGGAGAGGAARRVHPRRPTQTLRLVAPEEEAEERRRRRRTATAAPSVATLAKDVVHNMEGLFAQPG